MRLRPLDVMILFAESAHSIIFTVESPEVNFNYRTGHALAAMSVCGRFAAAFLVGKFGRLYL